MRYCHYSIVSTRNLVVAMLKLKKWYLIGKKEFPTPCFYGNDLILHDVSTVNWIESEHSFTHYKGMIQGLPEITDEIQAIEALAALFRQYCLLINQLKSISQMWLMTMQKNSM